MPEFLRGSDADAYFRDMAVVAHKPDGWVRLMRCASCSQHWQVDAWDKHSTGLAIKVSDARSWPDSDDLAIRKQALIDLHGGLSEQPCRWAGCANRALQGSAYCPDCSYHKTGLRE